VESHSVCAEKESGERDNGRDTEIQSCRVQDREKEGKRGSKGSRERERVREAERERARESERERERAGWR